MKATPTCSGSNQKFSCSAAAKSEARFVTNSSSDASRSKVQRLRRRFTVYYQPEPFTDFVEVDDDAGQGNSDLIYL